MNDDPTSLSDDEIIKRLRELPPTDLGEHDPADDALVEEAARRRLDY